MLIATTFQMWPATTVATNECRICCNYLSNFSFSIIVATTLNALLVGTNILLKKGIQE